MTDTLDAARADVVLKIQNQKASKQVGAALDPRDPITSARRLVGDCLSNDWGRLLHYHRGCFWEYDGVKYVPREPKDIRAKVWHFLEGSVRWDAFSKKNVPFKPTAARVSDMIDALAAVCNLDSRLEAPAWLDDIDLPHPREMFPVGNGLLHLLRSGKGTIGRVLTALLGRDSVRAPTLAGLQMNFGLSPLIGKPLAIVSDARLSGKSDQAIIAERLLSISGEDAITIDRKHAAAWTGRLPTRFMILTNELPRIADSSGALVGRFVVLILTRSFYDQEDPALADKLCTELSGILNWALVGYRRLRDRGYFIQPTSSREAIDELAALGSPVRAFVRDCCVVGAGNSVPVEMLYHHWKLWCQNAGHKEGSVQTFGRDLRAAVAGLRNTRPRDDRTRQYEGLRLKRSDEK
jgi:P4 family phage/plasmid primase-like protien